MKFRYFSFVISSVLLSTALHAEQPSIQSRTAGGENQTTVVDDNGNLKLVDPSTIKPKSKQPTMPVKPGNGGLSSGNLKPSVKGGLPTLQQNAPTQQIEQPSISVQPPQTSMEMPPTGEQPPAPTGSMPPPNAQ
jgi:hypothetical protein